MAAEYTVGNSAFLQTLVCYLFRCKLHAPFLPMSKLHVLSAANCRKAQDGSVPRRFPLAPWVLLPDGSQPRRFRWQLRPTYTRIHPSSATWSVSAMASRFGSGRWVMSHSCGIGGAVHPINRTRLVTPSAWDSHWWILFWILWKLKSLLLAPKQQAHATRSKPLLVGRQDPTLPNARRPPRVFLAKITRLSGQRTSHSSWRPEPTWVYLKRTVQASFCIGEAVSRKGTSHQKPRNQMAKTAAVGNKLHASLLWNVARNILKSHLVWYKPNYIFSQEKNMVV